MPINNFKEFFKGKKITVMGLGLLGGAVNDARYLLKHGADLIITDLKTKEQLKSSVDKLKKYKNVKFVLGGHQMKDFKNIDAVLQPGNVPRDSIYLLEARKNKIPIFVSESLFIKYAPEITLVGVTGTRGKSMTTALIYEILKSNENFLKKKVFLGGNMRGISTLALLDKITNGDIVVMELDSWALHSLGDLRISPNVSVFTSFMPDHMNYYGSTTFTTSKAMKRYFDDKANIFKYQKRRDVLVTNKDVLKLIKNKPKSKIVLCEGKSVSSFDFTVPGEHQRQNLSYAVAVAQMFGVPIEKIKKTVENFEGLPGRLQYIKSIRGIKIYNDNNATTPEATIAGIKALVDKPAGVRHLRGLQVSDTCKKIVLICGGSDKNLPIENLIKEINQYCKAIIMIPGTGTDKLISTDKLLVKNEKVKDLKEAIKKALVVAEKGDTILFSPAFASFGQFNNEYERNDLFMNIIKNLPVQKRLK